MGPSEKSLGNRKEGPEDTFLLANISDLCFSEHNLSIIIHKAANEEASEE